MEHYLDGLRIEAIGGFCPCQALGHFRGYPFYFRARHGAWTLEVTDPGKDPVGAEYSDVVYAAGHNYPNAGWMRWVRSRRIVEFCFEEFIKMGLAKWGGAAETFDFSEWARGF